MAYAANYGRVGEAVLAIVATGAMFYFGNGQSVVAAYVDLLRCRCASVRVAKQMVGHGDGDSRGHAARQF